MRAIDADALYEKVQHDEELARNRVLDTESTLPYPNNLNPSYTRYAAQMDERTRLKHMIADAPTIEPEIIHCKDCKHWREGDAYSYCQMLFNSGVLDVYDYMREEDDYCSYAKRREE